MSDIYLGDCREVRSAVADNSVDTIITDPPYGLEFMGKGWDKGVPGVEFWKDFLAVTKPGGMLLAFGGTRTFHRLTVAIEDAGWEIRDCMMWLYGSGFPKSLDISKAIDKAKGAGRKKILVPTKTGNLPDQAGDIALGATGMTDVSEPVSAAAKQWDGWGTALKPAWEPIIVAMKPIDGTYAENAEKWGVAGINVDGGRISTNGEILHMMRPARNPNADPLAPQTNRSDKPFEYSNDKGRWPANLILDEEAAGMLGEPARFFYCAKASKRERNEGCDELPALPAGGLAGRNDGSLGNQTVSRNTHPTVKPLSLMEYLCTLTKTPTGGVVLDPFSGSGTTLLAARNTGREYIGIEQNPEYFQIIKARLGI